MGIEEEIADEISGIQVGTGYYSTTIGIDAAKDAAAALSPLLNRVRAETLREAARFLRSSDNPQRGSDFRRESYVMDDAGYQLFVRADAIEQNSEGNET